MMVLTRFDDRRPAIEDRVRSMAQDSLIGQGVQIGVRAPVKTGEVSRMKESYGEGLATHPGPESCAGDRKVGVKR